MVITLKQGANKKSIRTIVEKVSTQKKAKGINAHDYCGKIHLKKDALVIQKQLRNEWH